MPSYDSIFVKHGEEYLQLQRSEFEAEAVLQRLIAEHPDLLGGGLISPKEPLKWLLVTQEAGIPDSSEGGARWSIDHLLLDQHATPTFVEVKRSSDTRIRREVVGQMLEYAANATAYWPVERIRELALKNWGTEEELHQKLSDLLGPDHGGDVEDLEAYWARVADRLSSGSVRLLFVADVIPPELGRIIEFMNEHMHGIEVAGVEIGHYSDGERQALVPRLVGVPERLKVQRAAATGPTIKTSQSGFVDQVPEYARSAMNRLLTEAKERGLIVYWGTKGFSIRVPHDAGPKSIFYGYPPGANGRDCLHLQGYLNHIPEPLRAAAAARFMDAALFEQRTKLTLNFNVDAQNSGQIPRIAEAVWSIAEMLAAEPPGGA